METMVAVQDLTKYYGPNLAISRLNFEVAQGEIVGFLGPNGAGKTTTLKILAGFMPPTSGSALINGHDCVTESLAVRRSLGYLPETVPLYTDLTVTQFLRFAARAKGVESKNEPGEVDRVVEACGLPEVRESLISSLSKGFRQRLGLAQALLHSPPLLILDEPTIGLDPRQIIEIRNLIRDLGKEHTIILSSHILPEVTAICGRVIIIHRGSIVASDTIANLSRKLAGGTGLTVRFEGPQSAALAEIRSIPEVAKASGLGSREPGTADVRVQGREGTDVRRQVAQALNRAKCTILMMRSSDLDLEEIFIQVTGEEGEI